MKAKRPLRSSKDVYDRLKWDPSIPVERVWIGYMDRMEGLMELPFNRFRPGGRIPWDRLWYFRLDKRRIWDREARIDLVFGSGETETHQKLDFGPVEDFQPTGLSPLSNWRFDAVQQQWLPDHRHSPEIQRQKLRIVTWNILRTDSDDPPAMYLARLDNLLAELEALQADVIALQEVTPLSMSLLLAADWVRAGYWCSAGPDAEVLEPHGEVLLSRFPADRLYGLEYGQGKRATLGHFTINQQPLWVATFHLHSARARQAETHRLQFLSAVLDALPGDVPTLLAADFNFDLEPVTVLADFEDLWRVQHAAATGPTYDPLENALAAQNAHNPLPRRLDRIYLRGPASRYLLRDMRRIGLGGPAPSDHFGLVADLICESSFDSLQSAPPVHRSALALIPPVDVWADIQAIRKEHDPAFARWMPHINLLYGFLPEALFEAAAVLIAQVLEDQAPFSMRLDRFDVFQHARSATIWLAPDAAARERLIALQSALAELFPTCREQNRHGAFEPHLTVAKTTKPGGTATNLQQQLQATWPGITFEAGALCLISRRGDGPFRIRRICTFGKAGGEITAPHPEGLEQYLGAAGLLPGAAARHARAALVAAVTRLLKAEEPKAKCFTVGSEGLETQLAGSDLDLLCIGHRSREAVFAQLARAWPGQHRIVYDALVPVLKIVSPDLQADILYAQYPETVPLQPPSRLSTAEYRLLPEIDRIVVAGGLEVAALRRYVGADRRPFVATVRALKAWAKARQLDENAFGYPGGLAWTLLVAAIPPEESADLWLERCFAYYSDYDWNLPVALQADRLPAVSDAAMQVCTAAFPTTNVTRNVTPGTLSILQSEILRALDLIWDIESGRIDRDRLFEPIALDQGLHLGIYLRCAVADKPACRGWVQRHFLALLLELETVPGIAFRPGTRWHSITGKQESVFHISLSTFPTPAQTELIDHALSEIEEKFTGWDARPGDAEIYFRII